MPTKKALRLAQLEREKQQKAMKESQVTPTMSQRAAHFERLEDLFERCYNLMEKKNQGYTGLSDDPFSNLRDKAFDDYLRNNYATIPTNLDSVTQGILTRFGDKVQRVQNIIYSGEAGFETLEDTIMDGINYLAILYSYLQSKRQLDKSLNETWAACEKEPSPDYDVERYAGIKERKDA